MWVDSPSQKRVDRDSLAAFDLTTDMYTSFSLSLDAGVNALDVRANGNIVAEDSFSSIAQAEELRVVPSWPRYRPDGTVLPWTSPPFGKVFDIDVEGGPACGLAPSDSCILTGQADVPGQHVPNNTTVLYDGGGSQLWRRFFNGDVQAVGWAAGRAIAGGHFSIVRDGPPLGNVSAKKVAALYPDTGHVDVSWQPGINSKGGTLGVWGVTGYADALYLGGDFVKIQNRPLVRMAEFEVNPAP